MDEAESEGSMKTMEMPMTKQRKGLITVNCTRAINASKRRIATCR